MKIKSNAQNQDNKTFLLIKRTLLSIVIIVVAFFVAAESGTKLRDYLIYTIHNTHVDIEDSIQRITLNSIYYYSAVYDLHNVENSQYIELELSNDDVYKVEFCVEDDSDYILICSTNTTYSKYLYLIPERIRDKGFDTIKITPLCGEGDFWVQNVFLHENVNIEDFSGYEIVDFEIKQIEIKIEQDDLEGIAQHRANALFRGRILPDDEEEYDAVIYADGKKNKIGIRLKGGYVDHVMTSKWSFRITVEDGSVWGVDKFSIHRPEARNGIYEYLMHNMYDELGGVSAYYDFAQVIINGEYWGVYAIEQSASKLIVENSLKREGAIITVEGDYKSYRLALYDSFSLEVYEYSPFKVVSQNKALSSETLYGYSQYAIDAYYKVIKNELLDDEVFDYEMYAKYLALTEVFRGNHGLNYANSLIYYNPITALLEPISFDMLGMFDSYIPTSAYRDNSPTRDLFDNPEFMKLYIKYLKEITLYYDEFIENNKETIEEYNYLFKLDNVKIYDCDTDLDEHHAFILDTLESEDSVFTLMQDEAGQYYIDIESNSVISVDVQEILLNDEPLPLSFNGRELTIYLNTDLTEEDLNNLKVKYKPIYTENTVIKTADVVVCSDEVNQ